MRTFAIVTVVASSLVQASNAYAFTELPNQGLYFDPVGINAYDLALGGSQHGYDDRDVGYRPFQMRCGNEVHQAKFSFRDPNEGLVAQLKLTNDRIETNFELHEEAALSVDLGDTKYQFTENFSQAMISSMGVNSNLGIYQFETAKIDSGDDVSERSLGFSSAIPSEQNNMWYAVDPSHLEYPLNDHERDLETSYFDFSYDENPDAPFWTEEFWDIEIDAEQYHSLEATKSREELSSLINRQTLEVIATPFPIFVKRVTDGIKRGSVSSAFKIANDVKQIAERINDEQQVIKDKIKFNEDALDAIRFQKELEKVTPQELPASHDEKIMNTG